MKLTIEQIVTSANQLQDGAPPLPGPLSRLSQTAPLLMKNAMRFEAIVRQIDQYFDQYLKIRNDLIIKYGKANGDGQFTVNLANAAFQADYAELMATEVEIVGRPFKVDDFVEGAFITPTDLAALGWLIENENEAVTVKPLTFGQPSPEGDDLLEISNAQSA